MSRLAPKLLELDNEGKKELEKILARHSTSQQVAKRAKIIILASEGKNQRNIARELEISRKMARLWRERWVELKQKDVPVRERLSDLERPGSPAKFTTEQILQLFAIACESPEKYSSSAYSCKRSIRSLQNRFDVKVELQQAGTSSSNGKFNFKSCG